jgi:zinc transporter, ZIP family
MGEAFFWGLIGGSSLLIGAALGLLLPERRKLTGLALAFGAGTLVSALTFELTRDAYRLGGADAVTIGLATGALAYFLGDQALSRRTGGGKGMRGRRAGIPATALLLGAILDGIPESAVIGLGLLEDPTVSVPVLAAVFISNLPEGFVSAQGMKEQPGTTRGHIIRVWSFVVLICGASSALGYWLLDGASGNWVGGVQAFAAGAVLTMLVETMFPEALKEGGKVVSLVTVLGFALAFLLTTVE